mmetsp:Transcript_21506/g.21629  ORF Transcript_21506/g.21629 Transcript_21506/m.21629 type:complete len:81 (+) Transcript_21506:310-552(+)
MNKFKLNLMQLISVFVLSYKGRQRRGSTLKDGRPRSSVSPSSSDRFDSDEEDDDFTPFAIILAACKRRSAPQELPSPSFD